MNVRTFKRWHIAAMIVSLAGPMIGCEERASSAVSPKDPKRTETSLFDAYPEERAKRHALLARAKDVFPEHMDLYLSASSLREDQPTFTHLVLFGVDEAGGRVYLRLRSQDATQEWQIAIADIMAFRETRRN